MMMETFGVRLKRLRLAAGLSVYELADRANLWCVTVFAWERGAAVPSFKNAVRLARALRVPLDTFADVDLPEHGRPRQVAVK